MCVRRGGYYNLGQDVKISKFHKILLTVFRCLWGLQPGRLGEQTFFLRGQAKAGLDASLIKTNIQNYLDI